MISMTGYGQSQYQDDKINCSLEIKSYNNRYLDLVLNIPNYLGALEQDIRDVLSKVIQRGRVEIYLKIREKEEDLTLIIDQGAAMEYYSQLTSLAEQLKLEECPSLSQLLSMEGVVKVDKQRDPEKYRELLRTLLDKALEELQEARVREGLHTKEDIQEQLDHILHFRDRVKELAPQVEAQIHQQLNDKFQQVMGDSVEESRILTEVASYLVRYDINEEISRLSAHLASFKELMDQDISLGKKLDFLCQEMNREINTIGSKSPQVEVHRLVVDAKDSMEKIREQLRNVQ